MKSIMKLARDRAQHKRDESNLAQTSDAQLNWEQAFLESHVVGSVGAVPTLVEVAHMPSNEDVMVLDFKLPPGLDKMMVKMAAGRLRVVTGNAFLSVIDSPLGPHHITIQASRENPLPTGR